MIWFWIGFNLFVLTMLALDLGVFNRHAHAVSVREASIWSAIWITLALIFNAGIYFWRGTQPALEFLTGYVIEYSLSVDNIFIFVLLFSFFSVPRTYQHRVLFWGVLGALVMRGVMIMLGAALLEQFHWVIYIFGAFLVFTGIRLAFQGDEEIHPENNPLLRLARRMLPVTKEYVGDRFFVRHAGKLMVTPLFLVLLVVESTDLVFAVDSIPAIFAVTKDPFIVYTSNVFAIMGLRSLYFLLAGVIDKFHYLRLGLAGVLTFVGVKMLMPELSYLVTGVSYEIPITVSLLVIALLLGTAVVASLIRSRRLEAEAANESPITTSTAQN